MIDSGRFNVRRLVTGAFAVVVTFPFVFMSGCTNPAGNINPNITVPISDGGA